MASALKCDVCGKYYDHYKKRFSIGDCSMAFNVIYLQYKETNGITVNYKEMDLCPDCLEKIVKILNSNNY